MSDLETSGKLYLFFIIIKTPVHIGGFHLFASAPEVTGARWAEWSFPSDCIGPDGSVTRLNIKNKLKL